MTLRTLNLSNLKKLSDAELVSLMLSEHLSTEFYLIAKTEYERRPPKEHMALIKLPCLKMWIETKPQDTPELARRYAMQILEEAEIKTVKEG